VAWPINAPYNIRLLCSYNSLGRFSSTVPGTCPREWQVQAVMARGYHTGGCWPYYELVPVLGDKVGFTYARVLSG